MPGERAAGTHSRHAAVGVLGRAVRPRASQNTRAKLPCRTVHSRTNANTFYINRNNITHIYYTSEFSIKALVSSLPSFIYIP